MRFLAPILALILALAAPARAQDTVADHAAAIREHLTAIEKLTATPAPGSGSVGTPIDSPPANAKDAVRCDTVDAMRKAALAKAAYITTKGVVLKEALDLNGATVELIDGSPSWQPAFTLQDYAELSNCTILTHGAKGILVQGAKSVTVRNVAYAPGGNYFLHIFDGKAELIGCSATTMTGYWVYQEPGTYVHVSKCSVVGGSLREALFRCYRASYLIEDSLLDASQAGEKLIALRGNSIGTVDAPGGIVRRTKLVGIVGPNPLGQGDGGQLMGTDRWMLDGGIEIRLPARLQAKAAKIAQDAASAGKKPAEIVRLTWAVWADAIDIEQQTARPKGLTDKDIAATLARRADQLDDTSAFLIEDSTIVGQFQAEPNAAGIVRNTTIDNGSKPAINGVYPTYPWPTSLSIVPGELRAGPQITFDGVELKGLALGVDLKTFSALTFTGAKLNGKAIER